MITLTRITNAADASFHRLMSLYTEAFPSEERRDISRLEEMIAAEPAMYFNAVACDGELAGLCVYWDFDDFFYLEHLAVYAELRNKKIGGQILEWMGEHLKGIRLLEVEPADTEMAARRIQYYRRHGYSILDKTYLQPSYDGKGQPFPLWIMGNKTDLEPQQLEAYIERIKNRVYYRK